MEVLHLYTAAVSYVLLASLATVHGLILSFLYMV